MQNANENKIAEVRYGRVIATVWKNGDDKPRTRIGSLYKDKESGKWRTTTGFLPIELPLVEKVVAEAFKIINTPKPEPKPKTQPADAEYFC